MRSQPTSAPSAEPPLDRPPDVGIGRAAGLGILIAGSSVVSGIIRSKVTAVNLGPDGMGISGEVLQYISVITVPLTILGGQALIREITASARGEKGVDTNTAINAALGWSVIVCLVLGAGATLAAPLFLGGAWVAQAHPWIALAAMGGLATGLLGIATTALTTFNALRVAARVQVVASVLAAALVSILTWVWGLSGLFWGVAIAPMLVLSWALGLARRTGGLPPWRPVGILNTGYIRRAFAMGAYSMLAGFAYQGALLMIRITLDRSGGPSLNGQFQASWAIGAVYLGAVLSGIGSHAFPRYASASNVEQLSGHVREAETFVFKYAPPLIMLALVFREPALHLLYSNRFDVAAEILAWQLVGDLAKSLSWVYAGPLMLRGHFRTALAVEVFGAVGLAGFSALLVPRFGASGAGLAYLLAYCLYLPVAAVSLRWATGVQTRGAVLAQALALTAFLSIFVALFDTSLLARCLVAVAALGWMQRVGLFAAAARRLKRRV